MAGVIMPDSLTVEGETLRLNGMGLRTFTFLQVHGYVAGLYVKRPSQDADAILSMPGSKLMRIQYVHAASISRGQDELRLVRSLNCTGGCPKSDDSAFAQLLDAVRPVKPGDVNTYVYGPASVEILFNGKSVTTIQNADFARRMLGGMIGAHPPSKSLRDGLLAGWP